MQSIAVFGDSIAFGYMDVEGGWVARLWRKTFTGKTGFKLYNLSIPGETTRGLLARIELEAKARNLDGLVFAIGINDSQLLNGMNKIPAEEFEANIKKLASINAGKCFIGLTGVDESKTRPVEWNRNGHYLNAEARKYNSIIKDVCSKLSIPFLDLKMPENWNEMLHDGIHPNGKGHAWLFSRIYPFLRKEGFVP